MNTHSEHRINLSRQWEIVLDHKSGRQRIDLSGIQQLELPMRLVRKFNVPTQLDSNCKVVLAAENFAPEIMATLNDDPLSWSATGKAQFESEDIRNRLKNFNHLELQLSVIDRAEAAMQLCIRPDN